MLDLTKYRTLDGWEQLSGATYEAIQANVLLSSESLIAEMNLACMLHGGYDPTDYPESMCSIHPNMPDVKVAREVIYLWDEEIPLPTEQSIFYWTFMCESLPFLRHIPGYRTLLASLGYSCYDPYAVLPASTPMPFWNRPPLTYEGLADSYYSAPGDIEQHGLFPRGDSAATKHWSAAQGGAWPHRIIRVRDFKKNKAKHDRMAALFARDWSHTYNLLSDEWVANEHGLVHLNQNAVEWIRNIRKFIMPNWMHHHLAPFTLDSGNAAIVGQHFWAFNDRTFGTPIGLGRLNKQLQSSIRPLLQEFCAVADFGLTTSAHIESRYSMRVMPARFLGWTRRSAMTAWIRRYRELRMEVVPMMLERLPVQFWRVSKERNELDRVNALASAGFIPSMLPNNQTSKQIAMATIKKQIESGEFNI